jgi:hypothetical protein
MVENPNPEITLQDSEQTREGRPFEKYTLSFRKKYQAIRSYFREIDNLAKMMQEGMDNPGMYTYR